MKSIIQFLKKDLWQTPTEGMPSYKAMGYRFLRTLLLTYHGFVKVETQQSACALTYYSLLALVPTLAILAGIARGFVIEKNLESWFSRHFQEQREIIHQIFSFTNRSIDAAKGGVIATIGGIILIWAAIKILSHLEFGMNRIWGIKKGRSLRRWFTDYLSMIFLAPILIFFANGATGYLSALFSALSGGKKLSKISSLLMPALNIFSFVLLSLLFTFLYLFMPNTRVRFLPALCAGFFTGLLYQLLQCLYFYFQIGVSNYNALYGTFAALPLFLAWLHLSWLIILLGAKLCFALHHREANPYEEHQLSHHTKILYSLSIAHLCEKHHQSALPPPTIAELSRSLSIPLALTTQLTQKLVQAGVLVEINQEGSEEKFQPAFAGQHLTLKKVIDLLHHTGEPLPLLTSSPFSQLSAHLQQCSTDMEKSKGNVLLKDL